MHDTLQVGYLHSSLSIDVRTALTCSMSQRCMWGVRAWRWGHDTDT